MTTVCYLLCVLSDTTELRVGWPLNIDVVFYPNVHMLEKLEDGIFNVFAFIGSPGHLITTPTSLAMLTRPCIKDPQQSLKI